MDKRLNHPQASQAQAIFAIISKNDDALEPKLFAFL
jgi:hypothetical protein